MKWRNLICAVVLTATACDPTSTPEVEPIDPSPLATVDLALIGGLPSLNPLIRQSALANDLLNQLYWPLLHLGSDGELKPALVESFSPEKNQLKVTLRQGLSWSDGIPISAEDIAFSHKMWLKGSASSELGSSIQEVEIKDPLNAVLTLKEGSSWQQAISQLPLVPYHAWNATQWDDLGSISQAVTGGPFVVAEHTEDGGLKLIPNVGFPTEIQPEIDLQWHPYDDMAAATKAAQDGKIDFVSGISSHEAESFLGNMHVESKVDGTLSFIAWNNNREPFSNPNIRQALTLSINRQDLIDQCLSGYGKVATSVIPSNTWAHDNTLKALDFSPEKAVNLFNSNGIKDTDGDGWLDLKDGPWLIELLIDEKNEQRRHVANGIRQQLRAVGIQVVVRPVPFEEHFTLARQREFDAMLLSIQGGDNVGLDFFHSDKTERGINFSGYSSPELDALIEQASVQPSPTTARPQWLEAQRYLSEGQAVSLLFERKRLNVYSSDLTGDMTAVDPMRHIWQWKKKITAP